MKKTICMIAALVLILMLVGCSCETGKTNAVSTVTAEPSVSETDEVISIAPAEDPSSDVSGTSAPVHAVPAVELPADDIGNGNPSAETTHCDHKHSVFRVSKSPTCEHAGECEYVCADCGAVLQTDTIEAIGHQYHYVADANEHKEICAICGHESERSAHTFVNGVCSVCGYGCAHHFTDVITDPTCTKLGYTTHTCSLCGYMERDTFTDALGHSYETRIVKSATCTEDGTTMYTCAHCKHSFTVAIPAHGHHAVADPMVAATCSTTGLTGGSHCDLCGIVLVAQEVIPVSEHVYLDGKCIWCGMLQPEDDSGGELELPEDPLG